MHKITRVQDVKTLSTIIPTTTKKLRFILSYTIKSV